MCGSFATKYLATGTAYMQVCSLKTKVQSMEQILFDKRHFKEPIALAIN
jgi:hypothetical protein